MRRSVFIALVVGACGGFGVRWARAQPVDPLNVKFRNGTFSNSVAIGNDLTVGDDLTVTDTVKAAVVDAGVVVTNLLASAGANGMVISPGAGQAVTSATRQWGAAVAQDTWLGGLGVPTNKGLYLNTGATIGVTSDNTDIDVFGGPLDLGVSLKLNAKVADSITAPTVTACAGGTAASITASNGTGAFQFDVGTACTSESTAVITLPAATTGWACSCSVTTADRMLLQRVMPTASTTTVTMQHITISTGANTDFTDSADVACLCRGI